MNYKKTAKKVYRKVIHPYVNKKKGYNNRMKLYKEVAALKKMVNAEKKNADYVSTALIDFAQNSGAGSGGLCFTIAPNIPQGSSEDQRNGDSIKVCSLCIQFEVMNNGLLTLQDTRYKFYIFRQAKNPVAAGTAYTDFLEPNAFSGVIDYNSNRNYQNFNDFTMIGMVSGLIKQSYTAGIQSKKQHIVARKQNFHIRFDKGATTLMTNQIYVLAVADSGDKAGTNKLMFQISHRLFFYDN